jgi:hypothetical protein
MLSRIGGDGPETMEIVLMAGDRLYQTAIAAILGWPTRPSETSMASTISIFRSSQPFGGALDPHWITLDNSDPSVLLLDMTGIGQKVVVSGKVSGAAQGTILLQQV